MKTHGDVLIFPLRKDLSLSTNTLLGYAWNIIGTLQHQEKMVLLLWKYNVFNELDFLVTTRQEEQNNKGCSMFWVDVFSKFYPQISVCLNMMYSWILWFLKQIPSTLLFKMGIHHFQTPTLSHCGSAHASYIFPVNKHTPTVGFASKTQLSPIQTPFTIQNLYILMTNPKGCDKNNSKPQLSSSVPFRAVHSRGRQEIRCFCFGGFWSPYS